LPATNLSPRLTTAFPTQPKTTTTPPHRQSNPHHTTLLYPSSFHSTIYNIVIVKTMLAGNALESQPGTTDPLYRQQPVQTTSASTPPRPFPPQTTPGSTPTTAAVPRGTPQYVPPPITNTMPGPPQRTASQPIPQVPSNMRQPPFPQQFPNSTQPTAQSTPPYDAPAHVAARNNSSSSSSAQQSPITSIRSGPETLSASPNMIRVRDLAHIESFAADEQLGFGSSPRHSRSRLQENVAMKYEISAMPVTDIIEMVAGLLTKITTTNDRQHEHLHRHIPPTEGGSGLNSQATSVLAFHGKNVPSITILSYLTRIHKYCPTTYEVFLSLLVYFDRMTERVNNGTAHLRPASHGSLSGTGGRERQDTGLPTAPGSATSIPAGWAAVSQGEIVSTPPPSGSLGARDKVNVPPSPGIPAVPSSPVQDPYGVSHFFVVDSFNIHRLVIAGVTCASKFFSDVFYTNSRYAKVFQTRHNISCCSI
jgi:PHO85 cyclin-6/7